jgi:hypothetical protein
MLESDAVVGGRGSVAWYTQGIRLPRFSIHASSCICFVNVGEASGIQQLVRLANGRLDRGIMLAG